MTTPPAHPEARGPQPRAALTRPDHLHDPLTGQHLKFLQTGRDTDGALLRVEVRLEPGGYVPRHVHVRQDERVEVLGGSVVVRVGRTERMLHAGDVVDVPRRAIHVLRNAGDVEAHFVLEVRPARRMHAAMAGLFALARVIGPLARLRRRVA